MVIEEVVLKWQLLFLESENPSKPLSLYINSPGGSVMAGLAIYDTMQYIRCPVSTLCVGQVMFCYIYGKVVNFNIGFTFTDE